MNITTKADIGDYVYFLANNKIITTIVRCIRIEVVEQTSQFGPGENIAIYYDTNKSNKIYEKDIFLTKQELLDSL